MDHLQLKELFENYWKKQEAMYPESKGRYSYDAQCALIAQLDLNWLDQKIRPTIYQIIGKKLLHTQELDVIRKRMIERLKITEEGVQGVVTADSGSCYGYHGPGKIAIPHAAFWYNHQGLPFIQDIFGKCFNVTTPIADGVDFDSATKDYELTKQETRAVTYVKLTHKNTKTGYSTIHERAKIAKEFWTELDKLVAKHTNTSQPKSQ